MKWRPPTLKKAKWETEQNFYGTNPSRKTRFLVSWARPKALTTKPKPHLQLHPTSEVTVRDCGTWGGGTNIYSMGRIPISCNGMSHVSSVCTFLFIKLRCTLPFILAGQWGLWRSDLHFTAKPKNLTFVRLAMDDNVMRHWICPLRVL